MALRRRPPTLFDYAYEDFELQEYRHHPPIAARVSK
jgi:thymidylate synthase